MDSNDIAGALGKLLEDPAALQKAMSIASGLMGNMQSENSTGTKPVTPEPEAVPVQAAASDDVQKPSAELSNLAALAPLLSGGSKNDPRCALLYALKPYMGHGRAEKIDTLVNLLRIADLAGGMLGGKLF